MATISSEQGYIWQHAFIYDSDHFDESTGCTGRIIDNDEYSGIRIVENKDRSSKKLARKCLENMYGNHYDVKFVFAISKKNSVNFRLYFKAIHTY